MENIIDKNNTFEICKLWAETIHQNILDSFTYYGYLQGLDKFFKEYECKNKLTPACVEFIAHQKYLLQTAICLNISKLLFDNGMDVYSLRRYKKKIDEYLGKHLNIESISIDKNLKESIISFRTKYIAHSIENSEFLSIKMLDLLEVLKSELAYFNAITDDSFLAPSCRLNDESVEKWIHRCETGVWDFMLLAER